MRHLYLLFPASSVFVEQRRRALKRFLTLIVRHPVLSKEEFVTFFLTAGGHEVGTRIKDKFKNSPEEFSSNPDADRAEVSHMICVLWPITLLNLLEELWSVTWPVMYTMTNQVNDRLCKAYYNDLSPQELVSEETRIKFDRVREQIHLMHQIISSMLEVAHHMETRSLGFSSDMKQFAANMRYWQFVGLSWICLFYTLV